MQTNLAVRFLPLAALLLAPIMAGAQSGYTITDLGSFNGNSYAYDINNKGQVVGVSNTQSSNHAFLYSGGGLIDLGNPGVSDRPDRSITSGYALNDNGQVVGVYQYGTQTNTTSGGFLYQNGQIQAISINSPQAINNAGQIIGRDASRNPAVYQNGVITPLNLSLSDPHVTSDAFDINNGGVIVGDTGANNLPYGYYYQNGVEHLLPQLASTHPGAIARAINDKGQIVGNANNSDGNFGHAVLWQNGQIMDLGSLYGRGSTAYDINNNGIIVGEVGEANGDYGAFVYQNGQMTDLLAGTLWRDGYATGINDSGQIVGFATLPSGYTHAFLATPNAVPEPGSALTFGVGIGVLLLAARRRKRNVLVR